MKTQINRALIESLSESKNDEFLEFVNNVVFSLVEQTMSDISEKSPFIRKDKWVLLPVNENYLGAFSQLSTYDYFLGVENPQLEINSKSKKYLFKFLWTEFKASWRIGKKKYKKKKAEEGVSIRSIERYGLSDFRKDVVATMAQYLTETSVIYDYNSVLTLIGRDDFGSNVRINIFICAYNSGLGQFKILNEFKNKFRIVEFGDRYANLNYKYNACGDMFVKMVALINDIFSKEYNRIPNQILVESLVNNCPDVLFKADDVYQSFVNVANFIRIADPKSIPSICDTSRMLFEEKLVLNAGAQMDFGKIISMLDSFKF